MPSTVRFRRGEGGGGGVCRGEGALTLILFLSNWKVIARKKTQESWNIDESRFFNRQRFWRPRQTCSRSIVVQILKAFRQSVSWSETVFHWPTLQALSSWHICGPFSKWVTFQTRAVVHFIFRVYLLRFQTRLSFLAILNFWKISDVRKRQLQIFKFSRWSSNFGLNRERDRRVMTFFGTRRAFSEPKHINHCLQTLRTQRKLGGSECGAGKWAEWVVHVAAG